MDKSTMIMVALMVVGIGFLAMSINETADGTPQDDVSTTGYSQQASTQSTRSDPEQSGGSGCGGGCCGSGDATETTPEELAREYYTAQTGETDFDVVIEDFGCHVEAQIIVDGATVMELSITGSSVTEI